MRSVEPRWRVYSEKPEPHLASFIVSLKDDGRAMGNQFRLSFRNPSIARPARKASALMDEAIACWKRGKNAEGRQCADEAVLRQIESLYFVYKTTASFLIVEARKSIEQCPDDERLDTHLARHAEARFHYEEAIDNQPAFEPPIKPDFCRLVDDALARYCLVIRTASDAFCESMA